MCSKITLVGLVALAASLVPGTAPGASLPEPLSAPDGSHSRRFT